MRADLSNLTHSAPVDPAPPEALAWAEQLAAALVRLDVVPT